MKVALHSLKDTKKYAKLFTKTLSGGEIICLKGDLGAGKTTFTKFVAHYLKIKSPVSSPTFTLIQEYVGKHKTLIHLDMYRVEDESEVIEIGLVDILDNLDSSKIVIIEWSENIPNIIKNYKTIDITIEKGDKVRYFSID